jgi:hypothetical protein
MKNDKRDNIWSLLHGELDEESERGVLREISADEQLTREFHARNELDLILHEALEEQAVDPFGSADSSEHPGVTESDKVKILQFSVWRRITQLAAVLAVVLGLVYVLAPQGDVRWSTTQVALLDRSRAGDSDEHTGLDVSTVKRVCADLKQLVNEGYGDEEPDPWQMRLLVSEHAGGAFEIRVEGRPISTQDYDLITRRRYSDVSSFQTNVQEFADSIVMSIRRDAP